jgi:hypothetical protein
LADEALSVLMGGDGHGDLGLVCVLLHLQLQLTSLLIQDEGDPYSLGTTLDVDNAIPPVSSTLVTPFTPLSSVASSSKVKAEPPSKTPSRASTPKSRTMLKHTLQDAFAEGSAKENEILECLGTQKHERAIGELELKRRKLENKAMEKQHQREREQHEFWMMQMRMMMFQNQQAAPGMMLSQPQNQALFNGFGFISKLIGASLPSDSPSLSPFFT